MAQNKIIGVQIDQSTLTAASAALTPTSVAATGTVTGSNLSGTSSGTNTGDQTITLTGGVTGSGTGSFAATVVTNANLTGDVTSVGNATTLANSGVTAGSYGQVTVDAKGRVTSGTTATDATHGGTAQTTYTTGDTLYASATNTLSKLAIGTTGQVLTVAGGVPTWAAAGGGGGGGVTFPIGSVIQAPVAPSASGETWLQCNGQAVSQSTYSTLYSAIGHAYMNFTCTLASSLSIATQANASYISCVGAGKWLSLGASTANYSSTDGITWTVNGVLSVAQQRNL